MAAPLSGDRSSVVLLHLMSKEARVRPSCAVEVLWEVETADGKPLAGPAAIKPLPCRPPHTTLPCAPRPSPQPVRAPQSRTRYHTEHSCWCRKRTPSHAPRFGPQRPWDLLIAQPWDVAGDPVAGSRGDGSQKGCINCCRLRFVFQERHVKHYGRCNPEAHSRQCAYTSRICVALFLGKATKTARPDPHPSQTLRHS